MSQPILARMRFLVFVFAFSMAVALSACAASKPTILISSPPSGSQFAEGEEIKVQSTATDSAGIDRVELIVDGIPVRTDPSPSPQASFTLVQTWKATAGAHVISVRAYNKAGGMSDVAAISVNVAPTVAQANTPIPGAPTPVAPTVPPPTLLPGVTPTVTPTNVPGGTCVNNAGFVTDVTIPDGMTIAAGQPFNKTWRMTNNGTCTWTNYEFVFTSGTAMTTGTIVAVPNLAPGGTVDITVPMTAPTAPGSYTGNWRMRSNTSATFGTIVRVIINVPGAVVPTTAPPTNTPGATGCSGTPVITSFTASATTIAAGASTTLQWGAVTNADAVEIDQALGGVATPGSQTVAPTTTTTYTMTARCGATTAIRTVTITVVSLPPPVAVVYDLVDKANLASWSSAGGNITFGGPDTDTKGFVLWRNNFKLNDNTTPSRVLETHPQWVANGRISGTFTDIYNSGYTVQASDKINGKIGFLNGGASGNATFKIMIRPQGGPNTWIVTMPLAYAEGTKSFSQSLAAYVGKRADFIIEVDAGASAGQDWAVWQDLRIIRGGP